MSVLAERNKSENALLNEPCLISPCEAWFQYFDLDQYSCFNIDGFEYALVSLLHHPYIGIQFGEGICLIFRIIDGDAEFQYPTNGAFIGVEYVPGSLGAYGPISGSAENTSYLNENRLWKVIKSDAIGHIIQVDIGSSDLTKSMSVSSICNKHFLKGLVMEHIDQQTNTIILLLEKDRIRLCPDIVKRLDTEQKIHVTAGMPIGTSKACGSSPKPE